MEAYSTILDRLLYTLQATDELRGMEDLEYIEEQGVVLATHMDGAVTTIHVLPRDGVQLLRTVVDTLTQDFV